MLAILYLYLLSVFHDSLFLALPIPVFFHGSFIVILFTFTQANFEFGLAPAPVHGQGNQCIALAVYGPHQLVDFLSVQKQFTNPGWFRFCIGSSR